MKTIAPKTYWKYLFWLGPILAVIGLSSGFTSGNWEPVPLGLIIAGIVTTGLWLLFTARETNWWNRRSTQTSTNALISTLAVLVILGLVNFLGVRSGVRVDLTETKLFTLAPETRQVIRNLQVPTKVWIFDRNQNPQDQELLENYRRLGPNFSFEYVDPQTRPGLADRFGVKEFGEVYLEEKRRKLVQVLNPQEPLSEVKLTNDLVQIQGDRTAKIYFLQGHGEQSLSPGQGGLSQALSQLGEKSYSTEGLNLAQSAIPKDATVVVVAGPKEELFDREVKVLRDYLNQGGSLLLMIDPKTNPKLDSLLNPWGVKLDNSVAVDVSGLGAGFGPAVPLVTSYGSHPITKDFGNGTSFYRLARPIETTPVVGVQATPLLLTNPYPESWAKGNLDDKVEFNPNTDRPGPMNLGVALSRTVKSKSEATKLSLSPKAAPQSASTATDKQSETKPSQSPKASSKSASTATDRQSETKASSSPEASPTPTNSPAKAESGKKQAESRLVVIGDSDFATDNLFKQQLNGDVFLNSVIWLSKQDEQPLSIRPKEVKNRRLNLKPEQASLLGWTALLLLPLIGFGASAMIWWLRR